MFEEEDVEDDEGWDEEGVRLNADFYLFLGTEKPSVYKCRCKRQVERVRSDFCTAKQQELKQRMYRDREMHKAVCADCGQECEVPFKPDGTRPVYCRECYRKRRPPRRY